MAISSDVLSDSQVASFRKALRVGKKEEQLLLSLARFAVELPAAPRRKLMTYRACEVAGMLTFGTDLTSQRRITRPHEWVSFRRKTYNEQWVLATQLQVCLVGLPDTPSPAPQRSLNFAITVKHLPAAYKLLQLLNRLFWPKEVFKQYMIRERVTKALHRATEKYWPDMDSDKR